MASPASVGKHPIHPMLIPFPIALWIFSLISDLIYGMGWGGIVWKETAFYTMAGGIIGALAAAIPGYLDYRTTTVPAIQKIGGWHMRINLFLVVLFSINLWLRTSSEPGAALPVILSVVGVAMLAVSGWLGGEMVYVHGAAVEPQKETASLKERDRAA
ncbi:MAG: hypothetical protein OJF51_001655 [Nitrospira sp.]|nr:MAG: hypothetical protein OJF51_001655 [Nitrospira sp.]